MGCWRVPLPTEISASHLLNAWFFVWKTSFSRISRGDFLYDGGGCAWSKIVFWGDRNRLGVKPHGRPKSRTGSPQPSRSRFWPPRYNPYSGHFLGLCGHILLQFQRFCWVFRNKVLQALRCVERRRFEVRLKVPILAQGMVAQTLKSDLLELTSLHLKRRSCQIIGFFCQHFCQIKTQFHGDLATSRLTRLAPNGRISTFDPPFDSPGSVLSSALRISAVRRTWEPLI